MSHILRIILLISGLFSCIQATQIMFEMTEAKRRRTGDVVANPGRSIVPICDHFVPISYMEETFRNGEASCTAKCPSCEYSMSYFDYLRILVKSSITEGVVFDMERVSKNDLIPYIRDLIEDNDTYGLRTILKLKIPLETFKTEDIEGLTVLDEAAHRSQEMYQVLLEGGVRFTQAQILESFKNFYSAIEKGGKNTLIAQIECGFDVNTRTKDGDTLLHIFISRNRPDLVAVLLQNGARTDIKSKQYSLPLHLAIKYDNPEVLRLIIDAKPDFMAVDSLGKFPFTMACTLGKLNAVKMLLGIKEAKADLIFTVDPNGFNVMHLAIIKGHVQVAEYMLNQGFPIYTKKRVPSYMLHCAVRSNHIEMLKLLLKKGASVYEPSFQNLVDTVNLGIQSVVINYRVSDPPAVLAVLFRNKEALEILLKNGFNANTRITDNTSTLLHLACKVGNYEAVTILVKYGADINAVDSAGLMAISAAKHIDAYHQAIDFDKLLS